MARYVWRNGRWTTVYPAYQIVSEKKRSMKRFTQGKARSIGNKMRRYGASRVKRVKPVRGNSERV
jgi:hypothetical protein